MYRHLASIGVLVLMASAVGAQEWKLEVPEVSEAPNYKQCDYDLNSVYARETEKIQNVIRVMDERIIEIGEQRRKLLDNKIFWGLGPKADSEEARQVAMGLQAVKAICDVTTDIYGLVNPSAGALGAYKKGTKAQNIYNLLKAGEFLSDIASAEGAAETTYVVTSELSEIAGKVSPLISLAENVSEAYENEQAWGGYRNDLRIALDHLDNDLREAQNRIHKEERRIYNDLRQGFEDFCAEEKPPRALDDQFIAEGGQTVVFPVTSNDRDPDGGPVRLVEFRSKSGQPLRGRTSIDNSQAFAGMLRYVAPEDFTGEEVVEYTIVDDEGKRARALVTIAVREKAKPADGSSAAANKGVGATAASVAQNQADIDAIWANCKNSKATDMAACIDAGLAGKGLTPATGREHPGCEQMKELIASDEAEIERQRRIAGTAQADKDAIEKLRERIETTRRTATARWKCGR